MPSLNLASILVADDRTSGRYRLLLEAERETADGTSVILHDLSQSGLLFEAEPGIQSDAEIMLHIPGIGPIAARTVWTNGSFYGAQFATPLTPDRLKAALAQSKVIWPAFAPPTPLDIEQARSRIAHPEAQLETGPAPVLDLEIGGRDVQVSAKHAEPLSEEPKLPLPVRIRIIVGLTIVLWTAILGAAFLAFG